MPGSQHDDLDWLYRRDPKPDEPEPTRILPTQGQPGPRGGDTPTNWDTPGNGGVPPSPPGYPPRPAYGQPQPDPYAPSTPYGPSTPYAPSTTVRPVPAPPLPGLLPQRKRRPVRTTLKVILIALLAAVVWLVGVPVFAWSHVGRVDAVPSGSRPPNQPGQTFLLVGSDSREGLTKAERKKLGTGSTGGQRTDTIMIVYVPPGGKPALISIPRDSYLSIPDHGKNKVNAAYAFGGPQLLVQTVESSTGLRVDGYLEIGFGGFVNIIDALGGITMCLPRAIKDRDSHIDLPKGCQTLSGVDALGYVRMRKADPRGDLGRVERQREMLAAIADKAASPGTVLNPVRYWRFCNAATDAINLGEDTSLIQMGTMALAMRAIAGGNGLTLTVPIANPGAFTPVGSAVLWDDAKAKDMFADIARGDTSGLKKYAK